MRIPLMTCALAVFAAASGPAQGTNFYAPVSPLAEPPPVPAGLADVPEIPTASIARMPSQAALASALARARLRQADMWVRLDYDDTGQVVDARVVPGTGQPAVDKAVARWARDVVVRTQHAGRGRMRVAFQLF